MLHNEYVALLLISNINANSGLNKPFASMLSVILFSMSNCFRSQINYRNPLGFLYTNNITNNCLRSFLLNTNTR